MGSWGYLYVGRYELGSFAGHPPDLYCSLFQQRERIVGEIQEPAEEHDGEDYTTEFVHYKTTVQTALRRLSLMGFSLSRCKLQYEKGRAAAIAELEGSLKNLASTGNGEERKFSWQEQRLGQLRALTFERWNECLKWLLEAGQFDSREYSVLMCHSGDDVMAQFGEFFCYCSSGTFPRDMDIRMEWTAVLSTFESGDPIVLDVSDLVVSGQEDNLVEEGWNSLRHGISENEPILILTEGSSDATILTLSLSALYPELKERFQFLDFSSSKYGGGAPSLVSQVKGFAAAGVRIRILGILDNDAAAQEALRPLEQIKLPDNIRVMKLPELEFAKNYPTVGPLGKLNGDVNGLAVSIEFFAGERLLTDVGGGKPNPVVCGSYYPRINTYQGELENKACAAKALRKSLSQEKDPTDHKAAHPELCELWEHIFKVAATLS